MDARKRRIPKTLTQRARTLRREATPQERILWNLLSRYHPRFTRQLSIPPYIADLACRQARLVVELDGTQHIDSPYDASRTRKLEHQGWTVIRFWNSDVDENPEGVAQAILLKAAECLGGTHPHPSLPGRGVLVGRAAVDSPPWKGGVGGGYARSALPSNEAPENGTSGRGGLAISDRLPLLSGEATGRSAEPLPTPSPLL